MFISNNPQLTAEVDAVDVELLNRDLRALLSTAAEVDFFEPMESTTLGTVKYSYPFVHAIYVQQYSSFYSYFDLFHVAALNKDQMCTLVSVKNEKEIVKCSEVIVWRSELEVPLISVPNIPVHGGTSVGTQGDSAHRKGKDSGQSSVVRSLVPPPNKAVVQVVDSSGGSSTSKPAQTKLDPKQPLTTAVVATEYMFCTVCAERIFFDECLYGGSSLRCATCLVTVHETCAGYGPAAGEDRRNARAKSTYVSTSHLFVASLTTLPTVWDRAFPVDLRAMFLRGSHAALLPLQPDHEMFRQTAQQAMSSTIHRHCMCDSPRVVCVRDFSKAIMRVSLFKICKLSCNEPAELTLHKDDEQSKCEICHKHGGLVTVFLTKEFQRVYLTKLVVSFSSSVLIRAVVASSTCRVPGLRATQFTRVPTARQ